MTLLRPHPEGIPAPVPSALSRPFWEGCQRGELLFQRCPNGHAIFIPAPICRQCLSADLKWERSAGKGHVYSWSVVWRPPSPKYQVPYAAAIVALDEGYAMIGNVIGCDHESVSAGLSVLVEFHPIGNGLYLPYFAPSGDPG
jgi:uncharacterized OB-fold protein